MPARPIVILSRYLLLTTFIWTSLSAAPYELHINIIYRQTTSPASLLIERLIEQLRKQQVGQPNENQRCSSKNGIETGGDTVFMRYPGLFPEGVPVKTQNQFAAAAITQDLTQKINLLINVIQSNTDGIIKYRAYLQLVSSILRGRSPEYGSSLSQYLREMETIDLSSHPNQRLLKSDLSFIRAYLKFEEGNIEEGLKYVNDAISADSYLLNARLLKIVLLIRRFDHDYQNGIYSNSRCHDLVDELFQSTSDIAELNPCVHQALAFAAELDGWTVHEQSSVLIPLAYLYKLARQDIHLDRLINKDFQSRLTHLPSNCTVHLFNILNEIKKVEVE